MAVGRLYRSSDEDFLAQINYRLHEETPAQWWGELILMECRRIDDGVGYIIELEEKRRGECYLENKVGQALSQVAPCYVYNFIGTGIKSLRLNLAEV